MTFAPISVLVRRASAAICVACAPGSYSSSTGSTRAEIAQLRSDFSALVTGKSDQSNFMTSTLIQFLKALQENLPAWPPGMAAVGGTVDTRA